jgi:hypothetical protein
MPAELLYNVKVFSTEPKNPQQNYYRTTVVSTYTDLHDAKEQAKSELLNEGYSSSDFKLYETNDGSGKWENTNGLMARAIGPAGERFSVTVEAVPNHEHIKGDSGTKILKKLYHVIQTDIDYQADETGMKRETTIQNTFTTLSAAKSHALSVLLSEKLEKKDYEEYTEYPELAKGVDLQSGEELIVHATRSNGMNTLVSVIETPEGTSSQKCN